MDENKILQKLVEHDGKLHEISDKLLSVPTKDELLTRLDGMAAIMQRLDQERVFTVEWIKRIENDVERIKQHLHI